MAELNSLGEGEPEPRGAARVPRGPERLGRGGPRRAPERHRERVQRLVERFDIEPFPDFSAK